MWKTLAMATLVLGIFFVVFSGGAKTATAQTQATTAASPKDLVLDLGNGVTLKLVQIPAGQFLMGSPETETDRNRDETQHEVTISKPFYMGVTHVTVRQYAQFVKDTRQKHEETKFKQTGDHPVVKVNWDDAQAFCAWLSNKSGKSVRLPTEAQWEYACRAGTTTRFSFGDGDGDLGNYAWYCDNSAEMTHPVGQKKPNAWGLYDMHGNAWQWCQDHYAPYGQAATTDPTGPNEGSSRVSRGGSWVDEPGTFRCALRIRSNNPEQWFTNDSFRVVVSPVGGD